jgi:folate-dependent phosphoribosylglycinamide formyltransferase PurN
MRQQVYDPSKSGEGMTIICFVSGSGTNYREIVAGNRSHNYLVFSNRPGCGAIAIARQNKHEVIELSHIPFLSSARKRYGPGNIPRNCPERITYEQEACRLIQDNVNGEPDLICLAGYDQWITDWMVEKYYPRILNVHPGDTTKGYDGLYWIPSAKAVVAGDETIRSTLFLVDKGEDTGPVLVQSAPLNIAQTVAELEAKGIQGLADGLREIADFASIHRIKTYQEFTKQASAGLSGMLERISKNLQDVLKVKGDWKIYPFAVHDLIAKGRVEVAGRTVYIDGEAMPEYGYRLDNYR